MRVVTGMIFIVTSVMVVGEVLESVVVDCSDSKFGVVSVVALGVAELAVHHDLFAFDHEMLDEFVILEGSGVVAEAHVAQRGASLRSDVVVLLALRIQVACAIIVALVLESNKSVQH